MKRQHMYTASFLAHVSIEHPNRQGDTVVECHQTLLCTQRMHALHLTKPCGTAEYDAHVWQGVPMDGLSRSWGLCECESACERWRWNIAAVQLQAVHQLLSEHLHQNQLQLCTNAGSHTAIT